MRLTSDEMWRAVVECDQSRDGQFFYGVRAVGVYCRPSCRSKTPLRENILYFANEEDARKAGFRSCKRCRPDLPGYNPASELAGKVKEVIDAYCNEPEQLAMKMKQTGVTAGHMASIFKQQYGLQPIQYLNGQRADQAKKLLTETAMPIIDIAGEIGFNSLPAFYRFFKKQAGITPKAYRAEARKNQTGP